MRNRALHDALREFALEAAELLTADVDAGAELEFEVGEEAPTGGSRRGGSGPTLYVYRPLTGKFIAERWRRLRVLPTCERAGEALGAGAARYLRVSGLRGSQAEPALQAMLERLYDEATSFAFPEERFERVYQDVERTLYRGTLPATVVAPVRGLRLDAQRVELGEGLALVRRDQLDAPPEAGWPSGEDDDGDARAGFCALERDVVAGNELPAEEARERFRTLVRALRLFRPGGVALGAVAWGRAADGPWRALAAGGSGAARGEAWNLREGEQRELRDFLAMVDSAAPGGPVDWALARFEMGCDRATEEEALSDYLLALRALLGSRRDSGDAGLTLRVAALCAEERERKAVQRRLEHALALERLVMGHPGGTDVDAARAESPAALVGEVERHLRALLRDVLCGYLDVDLGRVADDILLDAREPFEIDARDLREQRPADIQEQRPADPSPDPGADEADTSEMDAIDPADTRRADVDPVAVERLEDSHARAAPARAVGSHRATPAVPDDAYRPTPGVPDGVTPSADWADEEAESYSAPV